MEQQQTVYVEIPIGMTADQAIKNSTKHLRNQGYKESYRGSPYNDHGKTVIMVTFTRTLRPV